MNRWMARLAMSFFVVAMVLGWEAYQRAQMGIWDWREFMYLFATAAAIAMGVAGMREKHRRDV